MKFPVHDSFNRFIKDLNYLYKTEKAFFEKDFDEEGFSWKVVDDNVNSVFAYERRSGDDRFLVVLNMTNTYKPSYKIPYDEELEFVEVIDSLSEIYGNSRWDKRNIKIEKGEDLALELWEYEALVLKINTYER